MEEEKLPDPATPRLGRGGDRETRREGEGSNVRRDEAKGTQGEVISACQGGDDSEERGRGYRNTRDYWLENAEEEKATEERTRDQENTERERAR